MMRQVPALLPVCLLLCLSVASCGLVPRMESTDALRARAAVRQKEGLTVRSTPLSYAEQTTLLSSSPRREIQPIWVEVQNDTGSSVAFLPVGISRDHFPPSEVAFLNHGLGAAKVEDWYRQNAMPRIVRSGECRAGLVYVPQPPGAVAWNIELLGAGRLHRFAFAGEIPGFRANFDLNELAQRSMAPGKALGWPVLRGELAKRQACVTDASGKNEGDPLNVVIVAPLETLLEVAIRNDWKLAEPITVASSLRLAEAVIFGEGYPTGPVSTLFVEQKRQDLALQRPRHSAKSRNHMRLWLTDLRCEGKPVWLAQISRDIGVRFTTRTWNLSTHKIAPDVDEVRDNLVAEAISAQCVEAIGWADGVGAATPAEPRLNLTGDPYFTDGQRAVLFLSTDTVATSRIRRLHGGVHSLQQGLGGF